MEICQDKAVDELLWRRGNAAGPVQHHPKPQIILVSHVLDQETSVQEDKLQAAWNYWNSRSELGVWCGLFEAMVERLCTKSAEGFWTHAWTLSVQRLVRQKGNMGKLGSKPGYQGKETHSLFDTRECRLIRSRWGQSVWGSRTQQREQTQDMWNRTRTQTNIAKIKQKIKITTSKQQHRKET